MKKTALVLVTVLFCSCTATIQSNKSKDFNKKIASFYVVLKVADNSGNFVPKFSEAFQEGLKQRGVDVRFELVNPLALENDQDLIKRVSDSRVDALLTVSQVESVTYTDPNAFRFGEKKASGGTFDLKIFVPGNSRPVWRGLMKASSGGYGNIGAVSKAGAESVIQKLIQDGMI